MARGSSKTCSCERACRVTSISRFGLRRRVVNYAKRVAVDSEEAGLLSEIAADLQLDLAFKNELPALTIEPMMVPVWRVQLVRDPSSPVNSRTQISSPTDAENLLATYLANLDREHLVVLLLDTKNRVLGLNTVAIGTVNSTLVSARETFKPAILANATAIILGHNHPSGDVTPSPDDVQATRLLVEAGQILGIEVLDHIIIGEVLRFI